MDVDWLRKICLSLPAVTEDIKWGNDLCFLVAGKMFCVAGLSEPLTVGFKVPAEDFDEISTRDGFIPAPYMARAQWVLVQQVGKVTKQEWKSFIECSYELVKNKLTKKVKKEHGLE